MMAVNVKGETWVKCNEYWLFSRSRSGGASAPQKIMQNVELLWTAANMIRECEDGNTI